MPYSTVTPPDGVVGAEYEAEIMTVEGVAPYQGWIEGTLPPGIDPFLETQEGVVSLAGTPTSPGTHTFRITVEDRNGSWAAADFSFTVRPAAEDPLTLTGYVMPNGYVGQPYGPADTVAVTGGTPPYSYTAAGLPSPFTMNSSNGRVSGTPTTTGDITFTVTVRDSRGQTASLNRTFTVLRPAEDPLTLTGYVMPNGYVGQPYGPADTVAVTGGTPPYSYTAAGLPTPFTMNSSNGRVSGTPTTTGDITFTVTVRDSRGQTASLNRTFTVLRQGEDPEPLYITGSIIPRATIGRYYPPTRAVEVTGGVPPYRFRGADLPPGIRVDASTGDLSGTPTRTGSFYPVITVTDSAGTSKSMTVVLQVLAGLEIVKLPKPTSFVEGRRFSFPAKARGGDGAYSWTASGLPPGLRIDSGGLISGTPRKAGQYTVTITVSDTSENRTSQRVTWQVATPLRFLNAGRLPNGKAGKSYSTTIRAAGGVPGYRWSATGSLPKGMSLRVAKDGQGVILSGTPRQTGTHQFQLSVKDADGVVERKRFTLTIT